MTARCNACRRPMLRPSPDGLGPVCRARLTPKAATIPAPSGGEPLDHAALAANGQMVIPVAAFLPAAIPSARRRGRPVHNVPDIATYQPEEHR
ncbi:hypothetical protein [Streptomyces asiaticus]|uniref:hypothetical protein n=1 Tax=Streptomyces asiaticus TaxID=114695 RepID=UPI001BACC16E|nr:hypothetical protein [Streptomyces asiaticus]